MTQKWNLQDIRPSQPRRSRPAPQQMVPSPLVRTEVDRDDIEVVTIKDGNKEGRRKYLLLGSIAIFLIVAIFGLSAVLSKTTLTVYPIFSEPVVNAEFTAYPDKREGSLSYEVITIDATDESQVQATGEEYTEIKTEGNIEIIKTTAGAEKLIKNTRFRSTDGKVFRIQEAVTVPGAIKDSTGTLIPGTIRVKVVADQAGQEYNLGANTKFDVPGFKESNLNELYGSISAVNREAFVGGYKGQKFLINDAELSTTRQKLQQKLRDDLLTRIKSEIPAGFTVFESAVALTFNQLPTVSYGENLVTIKEQAFLQMPLFKQGDFAAFIAKETIPTYERESVRIVDTKTLEFSYSQSSTSASNIANLTALTFKIVGKPTIVAEFDSKKLQADLAGKSKTSISTVLTAHKGIKSARVASKPFWRRSFPEDAENIEIIEVVGAEK